MAELPMDHPPLVVDGIDLRVIASAHGPFTSLYVSAGSDRKKAAAPLLAKAGVENAVASRLLDALSDPCESSQAVVVSPDLPTHRFELLSPLHFDVVRNDRSPSLGPIIEEFQSTSSHAVITVEDDRYGLTTFGSRQVPDAEPTSGSISSTIHAVIERLRFATPRFIALVGSEDDLAVPSNALQAAFPLCWIQHYPTENLDADLNKLSDRIVGDADTRAAETITTTLGQYRAARDAGRTVEGEESQAFLEQGLAEHLLIHDDPMDDRVNGDGRLVDRCLRAAIVHRCRITMIPMIPADRGPAHGIGIILRDGASVGTVTADAQVEASATTDPSSQPEVRSPIRATPLA